MCVVGWGHRGSTAARSRGTWARVFLGRGVESPVGYTARLPPGVWWSLHLEQHALAWYHQASPTSLPSFSTSPQKHVASGSSSLHQAPCVLSFTGTSPERTFLAPLHQLFSLLNRYCSAGYFLHCTSQNLELISLFTCDYFSTTCEPHKHGTLLASVTSGHQPGT